MVLAPATTALLVFHATLSDQAIVAGTGADLADRVEASKLEGPALLMVGEALTHNEADASASDQEFQMQAS